MAIKNTVTIYDAETSPLLSDYTIEQRRLLFEYFDDLSEGIGEDIEFDPVAWLQDVSIYTLEELIEEYADPWAEYASDNDLDIEDRDEFLEFMHDHGILLRHDYDNYLTNDNWE